jgi:hypothetical protein
MIRGDPEMVEEIKGRLRTAGGVEVAPAGGPEVDEARLRRGKGQLRLLTEACDQYNLNNGHFPPSLQALARPHSQGMGSPLSGPVVIRRPAQV